MHHKKTHPLVKEVVEIEFCKMEGSVRVVFCNIAFGMSKVHTFPYILGPLVALMTVYKM